MSNLINALVIARHALIDFGIAFLIVVGGALLIGGCVYCIFIRPELTPYGALETLWPCFLAGTVALMLGWLIDHVEG